MTAEDIYWLKITDEPKEEKKFNAKEYQKQYYQKHKEYVKSKTQFHRKKKNENSINGSLDAFVANSSIILPNKG